MEVLRHVGIWSTGTGPAVVFVLDPSLVQLLSEECVEFGLHFFALPLACENENVHG